MDNLAAASALQAPAPVAQMTGSTSSAYSTTASVSSAEIQSGGPLPEASFSEMDFEHGDGSQDYQPNNVAHDTQLETASPTCCHRKAYNRCGSPAQKRRETLLKAAGNDLDIPASDLLNRLWPPDQPALLEPRFKDCSISEIAVFRTLASVCKGQPDLARCALEQAGQVGTWQGAKKSPRATVLIQKAIELVKSGSVDTFDETRGIRTDSLFGSPVESQEAPQDHSQGSQVLRMPPPHPRQEAMTSTRPLVGPSNASRLNTTVGKTGPRPSSSRQSPSHATVFGGLPGPGVGYESPHAAAYPQSSSDSECTTAALEPRFAVGKVDAPRANTRGSSERRTPSDTKLQSSIKQEEPTSVSNSTTQASASAPITGGSGWFLWVQGRLATLHGTAATLGAQREPLSKSLASLQSPYGKTAATKGVSAAVDSATEGLKAAVDAIDEELQEVNTEIKKLQKDQMTAIEKASGGRGVADVMVVDD